MKPSTEQTLWATTGSVALTPWDTNCFIIQTGHTRLPRPSTWISHNLRKRFAWCTSALRCVGTAKMGPTTSTQLPPSPSLPKADSPLLAFFSSIEIVFLSVFVSAPFCFLFYCFLFWFAPMPKFVRTNTPNFCSQICGRGQSECKPEKVP